MPNHPLVSHLPLVVAFLLPIIVMVFALMIRANKMSPKAWLIIVGLQVFTTGTGYLALETGETEEDAVEKVVSKKLIHEHEEAAEVFVGSTVLALVLGVAAFFIRKEFQFKLHISIVLVTLVSSYLAFRAGKLGGELVYVHGAAAAYTKGSGALGDGILPTPGMNTSESAYPTEDNEGLRSDENDYGKTDDMEGDDEEVKQED